jgi:hypothetical protein
MIYESGEPWWNDINRRKPKNLEKDLSQCHLSTTNPTWIDPGANLGVYGVRPVTNHLSHGTAFSGVLVQLSWNLMIVVNIFIKKKHH